MSFKHAILVVTLGMAVGLAMPTTAQAVGTSDPSITSPKAGHAYGYGYQPTLRVSFADAPAGTYDWNVDCPGDTGYHQEGTFDYEGTDTSPDVLAEDLPAVKGTDGAATDCTIYVFDQSETYTDTVTFDVQAKPMKLSAVSISQDTFYPLVRDGFKDTTKLRYTLNRSARVSISVVSSEGHSVRSDHRGWQSGSKSWTWNGRRNNGEKAPVGTYRVTVVANAGDTPAARVTRKVVLTTGWKILHSERARRGSDTSSRSRSDSCYLENFYGELHADCWGGHHARATWRFAVPATAYNITWRLPGEQGCCASPGHITRWGNRPRATTFVVGLEVTGWRSYYAKRAKISYAYKRRI